MNNPFDTATNDHPTLGRLFQFERDWLDSLGNAAAHVTHKDLALYAAGYRSGIARRSPSPATKAMLEWIDEHPVLAQHPTLQEFKAEWADPTTPPTAEQLKSSPWTCCVCGEPVRIASDLTVWHFAGATNHDAELSNADKKILADSLRLSD